MYGRMATFTENLAKAGKSLDQSVNHYNNAVASFTGRILPSAKKFKELGIETKKDLNKLEAIEKKARTAELENSEINGETLTPELETNNE